MNHSVRRREAAWGAVIAGCVYGCSSLGGLTGGADPSDAGLAASGDEGSAPGSPIDGPTCGDDLVCAPSTTGDWHFVALGPPDATCPAGYATPRTINEGISAGPVACACTCSPPADSPSCPDPELAIGNATPDCFSEAIVLSGASACKNMTLDAIDTFTYAAISGAGEACGSAIVVTSKPDVSFTASYVECLPAPSSDETPCPNGLACVPQVPRSFAICVASTSATTCPLGYPHEHTVGTDVTDTRACGGTCGCAVGVCAGTFTAYASAGCSGSSSFTVPTDDACHPVTPAGQHVGSYAMTYTGAPTCVVENQAIKPAGTTVFAAPEIVCCP